MPDQLNRVQLFQLGLLILAVPIQYFLTRANSENLRQYELKRHYFNVSDWIKWCGEMVGRIVGKEEMAKTSESVLKDQNKDGNFATSNEPRSPRPPHVRYRVGQVIKHKLWGYRGVIVGWDETAKAPKDWLDQMHPADKPEWRSLPNYAVLVDTRDRLTPQMAYVVEENVEVTSNLRIFHPLVDHYFETFDGARYQLRPWIRKVYPAD